MVLIVVNLLYLALVDCIADKSTNGNGDIPLNDKLSPPNNSGKCPAINSNK